MRFKPEQHFRMADLLSSRAIDETDLEKRDRIEAMARVFCRLAVSAYMSTDATMSRRDWSAFTDKTVFLGLIDPPSPWDRLEEWERYLAWLETLPRSAQLRLLIEQAEEAIVRRKLGLL